MFRTFSEVEDYIANMHTTKTIALCGAHENIALEAVVRAKRKGFINAILLGDEEKIIDLLAHMEEDPAEYQIIHAPRGKSAAMKAVQSVRDGRADILMKGLLQSAEFLTPIMMPSTGLFSEGSQLNEATVFYYPERNGFVFAGDCALNIAPSVEEKIRIINNLVDFARAFGAGEVKVAAVSALEKVNSEMPSTGVANQLAQMEWEEGIIVEGPFALDNALDAAAAEHKGIESRVAGKADILLMPEILSGNVLHKCVHFLAPLPSASVLCGADVPVVFNSRTDSSDMKYFSILSAILQSLKK